MFFLSETKPFAGQTVSAVPNKKDGPPGPLRNLERGDYARSGWPQTPAIGGSGTLQQRHQTAFGVQR
ncbi:MAG: hypothetical protein ACKOBF_15085, partial [Limnohabitans sp.]